MRLGLKSEISLTIQKTQVAHEGMCLDRIVHGKWEGLGVKDETTWKTHDK